MLGFGVIFGAIEWYHYASRHIPAPTGIILVATVCTFISMQLILSFLNWSIGGNPVEPYT